MRAFRAISGFTLAELLIALSILGIIATFTIPKVLVSQQDTTYKANAKDVMAAMSAAYHQCKLEGRLTTATKIGDLTPYLNYVRVNTTSVDDNYGDPTLNCAGSTYDCLNLHNGGVLAYRDSASFGGSASTNALPFFFDPDGKVTDGTTNGPGKSVVFFIYYNGRLTERADVLQGTSNTVSSYGPITGKTPPWFSWN